MDKDHWLNQILAEVENNREHIDSVPSLYGAADIAAKYCGFDSVPSPLPGQWQHGWKAAHRQLTAQYEMGELEPLVPEEQYWVARKDQEECLRQAGLHRAKAIGLPCVYLPESKITRHENSLLVMPAHSLDYTRHDWKFEEYADQIDSIRNDFDEVIACVHKSCFDRGLWVDSFRKRNIPVVVGAHTSDPLTLHRQQAMLCSFGFLTTNSHGSHLAYGAYWGARVSIFGSYANLRTEDFSNTPFYQRYPELLHPAIEAINEKAMREHYPKLFADHPRDAGDQSEWGATELGADNRLTPNELKQLFAWTWSDQLFNRLSRTVKKIGQAVLPRSIRKRLEKKPEQEGRIRLEQEISSIQASPSGTLSICLFQGKELRFLDGPTTAATARLFFEQQVARFHSVNPSPRIVVVGSEIGLLPIYMSGLHPDARILAVEPDPKSFELLEQNCQSFGINNVELRRLGVRSSASESDSDNQTVELRSLIGDPTDLLYLNISGNEALILNDCRDELSLVERVCIRVRCDFNQDQQLGPLVGILEESGFRIHIHSLCPAPQPLVHRPVIASSDLQLLIFAVRETKSA